MGNPLFNMLMGSQTGMNQSVQQMPMQFPNNPMQMAQMLMNSPEQLKQFASQLNGDPAQIGNMLLQSGRMTPQQFQQYSQIANMMLGRS